MQFKDIVNLHDKQVHKNIEYKNIELLGTTLFIYSENGCIIKQVNTDIQIEDLYNCLGSNELENYQILILEFLINNYTQFDISRKLFENPLESIYAYDKSF